MLLQSPFLPSGGMFDCRIDFIACCLYGTFVCLLVRSNGLREGLWLAAAAGCALLLLTFRFVTFAYLLGFCTTLFTLLLGLRLLWRGRVRGAVILARSMWRTLALGLGVVATGGALIAAHWQAIHDYYVVGHLTGNEKHIRALEAGVTGRTEHLTYYLSSLLHEHLGTTFLVTFLVLLAVGLAVWFGGRQGKRSAASGSPLTHGGAWVVSVCMILAGLFAPWFILTLDESKSPVVANVLDTPTALLLILLLTALVGSPARTPGASAAPAPVRPGNAWWGVAATFVLVFGSINWLTHLTRQGRFSPRRTSVEQIGALYDFLGDESARMGFRAPTISADMIYDWMIPSTINVSLYERSGRWLDARSALGVAIFAVPREQVFAKLEQSDFALISTFSKEGSYPFYDSIRPLGGEIRTWCEAHLLRLRVFAIDGEQVTVYVRPDVPIEGLSGGWITPAGVRLRILNEELAMIRDGSKSALILEGADNAIWLSQAPVASVRLAGPDGLPGSVDCPSEYTRPSPGTYRIRVDLGPLRAAVPSGGDAVVDLHLDGASFVPKEKGVNDDTRVLVVTRPSVIRFE